MKQHFEFRGDGKHILRILTLFLNTIKGLTFVRCMLSKYPKLPGASPGEKDINPRKVERRKCRF